LSFLFLFEFKFKFEILDIFETGFSTKAELGENIVNEIISLTQFNKINMKEDFYFKVGSEVASFILSSYAQCKQRLGLPLIDMDFNKNNIKIFDRPIILDKDIDELGLKIIRRTTIC